MDMCASHKALLILLWYIMKIHIMKFCHNARNESFEIGQKIISLAIKPIIF